MSDLYGSEFESSDFLYIFICMSILDDNICEQFEKSLAFFSACWRQNGWYMRQLLDNQIDGLTPIQNKLLPKTIYYRYLSGLASPYKSVLIGTKDDGFIRVTHEQFTNFIQLL